MAGIKETKDSLHKELLELYKRLTAVKPEEIFSGNSTKTQLQDFAVLASSLSQKTEALAYLSSVEEEKPQVVIAPPVPEIKTPEVVVPEITPVVEPIVPTVPVPQIIIPEIVAVVEKTTLPISSLENKQPEPAPKKIFPDVKSFIGLNEKLMFIRSLFKGEGTDYENAIAQVNNCASYSEAEAVLQNFSSTYKWTQDAEPVQIFYSIVKRRFA